MSEDQPKRRKNSAAQQDSGGNPTSFSLTEALTADIGRGDLAEAQEKGFLGTVWVEDNSQFTAQEVENHDQTGPQKLSGEYDTERAMEDHYIRGDLLKDR